MEDEEFLINNNNLLDDEDENINLEDSLFEEEFLKPSNILMDVEEEDEYNVQDISIKKEMSKIITNPEIKLIKYNRREVAEEDLFTTPKLIYDDKELDESDDNEEEDNYLFRPSDLIYEDRLELFNKRREQGIVMTSTKRDDKKKNEEIRPKGFLASLRDEIRLKALKK